MTTDRKPITETELKEWEREMEPWGFLDVGPSEREVIERLIAEVRRLRGIKRLSLDDIESVLEEQEYPECEIASIMVGMADRLGSARYRGHTDLGHNEECGNTDCDALGPHPRCFKDGRWLDDGSEM